MNKNKARTKSGAARRRLEAAIGLSRNSEGERVNVILPELRSDAHWIPTPGNPYHATPVHRADAIPSFFVQWRFGVPLDFYRPVDTPFEQLKQIATLTQFNAFLRLAEPKIWEHLKNYYSGPTRPTWTVDYLGTYLEVENGTPFYLTTWGYYIDSPEKIPGEWDKVFSDSSSLGFKSATIIRKIWWSDPGRSEARYGLAGMFLEVPASPLRATTMDYAILGESRANRKGN